MTSEKGHSLELQTQIDALYAEWRQSRAKWKTPRGRWFPLIQKLRTLDTYRYVPRTPLSEKELLSLRATLRTSRPTQMWHWSVRRDGVAVVIERGGIWSILWDARSLLGSSRQ
jgi:hypothetical protein